jgi:hypothetical protein
MTRRMTPSLSNAWTELPFENAKLNGFSKGVFAGGLAVGSPHMIGEHTGCREVEVKSSSLAELVLR